MTKNFIEEFIQHDSIKVQKQAVLTTFYLDYLEIHSWDYNYKAKHRNEQEKKKTGQMCCLWGREKRQEKRSYGELLPKEMSDDYMPFSPALFYFLPLTIEKYTCVHYFTCDISYLKFKC